MYGFRGVYSHNFFDISKRLVKTAKNRLWAAPSATFADFSPLLTHQDLPSCQISSFYDIGKCLIILMGESVSQS
jgi:hypothetical protein